MLFLLHPQCILEQPQGLCAPVGHSYCIGMHQPVKPEATELAKDLLMAAQSYLTS